MKLNPYFKIPMFLRNVSMLLSFLVLSICAFAQDKKVDVNINTDSNGGFFASPWVWVVGAAVFILLLVALLRGNSKNA
jgi:hypothetical protein